MNTQIAHLQHTTKKGYLWRKRYEKNTIEIALQTTELAKATARCASITIRFMQLEALAVPFVAMRDTLKGYRDELLRTEKLAILQGLISQTQNFEFEQSEKSHSAQDALQAPVMGEAMQSPTLEQKIQQITIQHELDAIAGHSLEEVKKAYFAASTEWHVKTIKDYSACIDRFIVWATASGVPTVEAVNKDAIISFKSYMDEQELAPNTKQKILTRLSGMFKFAVDVKEWIQKNPVTGLMYRKVGVVEKKEEVTPAQFLEAFEQNQVQRDYHSKWCNAIMFYTGMRVSEVQQLTKNDYVEIEGIKCFSVNTLEEGKSTKTETSIRNIPICDKLLEMGIWEDKPVMKVGLNSLMEKVSKAYSLIGLKRSSHCYRHSMSNRLRDTNADDSTRAFILGHAQANMTDRVYVTRAPLFKMQQALNAANQ